MKPSPSFTILTVVLQDENLIKIIRKLNKKSLMYFYTIYIINT